ncbi:COMM domain-containing protein 2-like [Lytechinus variegatus]|uniref:COMM domain-containing protein 2-like n=1 Tax=Lytechinus variegatus TaxID=7654 RepID=UPI001BB1F97F|nr:COMM domain-containing protein 2-like [Lytechinus variegatus]
MLLFLDDEHKEHLSFLANVDSSVLQEFCRIAIEFMRKGITQKVYQGAAQKLNVDAETVKHGVEGLMYLLTESARLMVSELDFQDSIAILGFSEDLRKDLLGLYIENRAEIRGILGEMAMDLPHYHNLEWRLDVELASRSLRHQTIPTIMMKLHTEDCGKKHMQVLQTDPVNLVHLTQALEGALAEVKTQHCRRIIRNINK